MLTIKIPETEIFDEQTNTFSIVREQELRLEHSLLSISKWESKWHKPYLDTSSYKKTTEMNLDYIKCMTITQNVPDIVYTCLTQSNVDEIADYIANPMTATWFSGENDSHSSSEVVTSELIYYWMTATGDPFSCEKWHINRLLTLIKICSIKNGKPKKMSQKETAARYKALNAARRAKFNSKG